MSFHKIIFTDIIHIPWKLLFEMPRLSLSRLQGDLATVWNQHIHGVECVLSLVSLREKGPVKARLGTKINCKPNENYIETKCIFSWGLWLGSGNFLLVSAGEGEEPLRTRRFQHLGLVASQWLGEPEKQQQKTVCGMGD